MSKEVFCTECDKFTSHIDKLDAVKIGGAVCDICRAVNPLCRLLKPNDVTFFEKHSKAALWIEFDENGRFKEEYKEPAIGRSLIMSPFNRFFTWQTTVITEIIEESPGYVKFNTKNSLYEFYYPIEVNDEENEDV